MEPSRTIPPGQRRVRHIVTGAYYVLVGTFALLFVGNIVTGLRGEGGTAALGEPCKPGLLSLASAVERAREAARSSVSDDERAALDRFREALEPEWARHDPIAAKCRRDPRWTSALDVIERLRYAEERAVRRDVSELSPLRRRVDQLLATRLRPETP